jgi:hypothetical protein
MSMKVFYDHKAPNFVVEWFLVLFRSRYHCTFCCDHSSVLAHAGGFAPENLEDLSNTEFVCVVYLEV